jgi:transcriptional regulator with XRE-family HTH domain
MLRLTLERRRRGLSQAALARLSDIHPVIISQLESRKVHPYPGWQRRLSRALGIPGAELFQEVPDPEGDD